jgi:threonine dehydrogenase-like Zn-dependent dehydrogenase
LRDASDSLSESGMKAVGKAERAPGIEVLDLNVPEVGPSDILVRVRAGSLCGSDVHIYEWTPGYEWLPLPLLSSGRIPIGEIITHTVPLSGAREGFDLAVWREAAKVLFIPG